MRHLDDQEMTNLLASNAEAVVYFRAHLTSACDACENYMLSSGEKFPWLEAEADRLLLGGTPAPVESDDQVEQAFQRLRLAMRKRRNIPLRAIGGALATATLCVLVIFGVRRSMHPANLGSEGEKSARAQTVLELRAALVSEQGEIHAISPNQHVPKSRAVVFRYHASRPGTGLLFVQRPRRRAEFLERFSLSSGTHDLGRETQTSAFSLKDEAGPLTFWLVHGPADLQTSTAAAAIERPYSHPDVFAASFPVEVVPGEDQR